MNIHSTMETLANIALPLAKSLDDRIAILTKIDLTAISDPESVLYHFEDIENRTDRVNVADRIAWACRANSGTIIITDEFYFSGRYSTIMDALEDGDSLYGYPALQMIFRGAFRRAGFKFAAECDQEILKDLYTKAGQSLFSM
jgi:hypothetical protein